MNCVDVAFREPVKFPTDDKGGGRPMSRMLLEHPVNPETRWTMRWGEVGVDYELVVTHVRSGASTGVPRANVAWARPALAELIAAKRVADATTTQVKKTG